MHVCVFLHICTVLINAALLNKSIIIIFFYLTDPKPFTVVYIALKKVNY